MSSSFRRAKDAREGCIKGSKTEKERGEQEARVSHFQEQATERNIENVRIIRILCKSINLPSSAPILYPKFEITADA
jgi:hypothetical protein